MKPIRSVPQRAQRLIAICTKCGHKLGGGFGPRGRQPLAKALRKALKLPKPKHATLRLVETRCLKLCPKDAVAVLDSGDPGHILVVPAHTPVGDIVARLGLG
jgi:predicted metal-binding protein